MFSSLPVHNSSIMNESLLLCNEDFATMAAQTNGALGRYPVGALQLSAQFPELGECPQSEEKDRLLRKLDFICMLHGRYPLCSKFTSKYQILGIIGDGTFGFVIVAKSLDSDTSVAVKFIAKSFLTSDMLIFDTASKQLIPREIFILRSCQHENVVQYVGHYQDSCYHYLVTELFGFSWNEAQGRREAPCANSFLNFPPKNPRLYRFFRFTELLKSQTRICSFPPTDLFECIEKSRPLPMCAIKRVVFQVAQVLSYLHGKGFIHGDVKDENILVDCNFRIKIADFGSSFLVQDEPLRKFYGTFQFASPEVNQKKPYSGVSNDTWAVGVLLFLLVTKQSYGKEIALSNGERQIVMLEERLEADLRIQSDSNLYDLLKKLLDANAETRITLQSALKHRWFSY